MLPKVSFKSLQQLYGFCILRHFEKQNLLRAAPESTTRRWVLCLRRQVSCGSSQLRILPQCCSCGWCLYVLHLPQTSTLWVLRPSTGRQSLLRAAPCHFRRVLCFRRQASHARCYRSASADGASADGSRGQRRLLRAVGGVYGGQHLPSSVMRRLHSRNVNGLSDFSSQALHSKCIPGQRPSAASMSWTWAPASRYKQRPDDPGLAAQTPSPEAPGGQNPHLHRLLQQHCPAATAAARVFSLDSGLQGWSCARAVPRRPQRSPVPLVGSPQLRSPSRPSLRATPRAAQCLARSKSPARSSRPTLIVLMTAAHRPGNNTQACCRSRAP